MSEKPYLAERCNVCDSTRFRQVRYFKEWRLGRDPVRDVAVVQCSGCGVRRRMPGISDNFEEEYHVPYVDQGAAIHPHQLSHFADLMSVRLRNFNDRGLRFLDVGCSTGRALRLAQANGFVAVGLDYSRWAAEYCHNLGFETRHGGLLEQWKDGSAFDIVHCSHTMEHVPDPVAYLSEIHRLLKTGGQAMIAIPNYASFPRVILGENWGPWCLDSHLWFFTATQMCNLLRNQGFSISCCRTLHGYTPDSRLKKRVLDFAALLGFGDGCNIVATKH